MTPPAEKNQQKEYFARLMMRAAKAAVVVAFTLILIKSWAYHVSGAVSLLGSLLDSLMDILASLINLVAVRFSIVPADDDHRFGHGKAEAIAGLVQAMVIFLAALFLLLESGQKLINPAPVTQADTGIIILVISTILTGVLVAYQRYAVNKTASVAISADRLHYTGDILMNLGVIVALVLSGYMQLYYADPVVGILVGSFLLYNVWLIGRNSIDMLMDREMEEGDKAKILTIIRSHSAVRGIHDMKTRKSGLNLFIQFHLEMNGDISLSEAHHISDDVEAHIIAEYPAAEVLIHADPEGYIEDISFSEQ
ncbi:MAG: cation diffusion facilitator family transporter [Alphaproteobacteria bacterium]|nr:cation diffusion facilitator family transporter [Alphaproteobacteria bacterium]